MKTGFSKISTRVISCLICVLLIVSMIPISTSAINNSYVAGTVIRASFLLPETDAFSGLNSTINYGDSLSYVEGSFASPHISDVIVNTSIANEIQLTATNVSKTYDVSADHIMCTADFTVVKDVNSLDLSCSVSEVYIVSNFDIVDCSNKSEINIDVISSPSVYLVGSFNEWQKSEMSVSGTVYSTTVELPADNYEFKVVEGDVWYGNAGSINDTTTLTSSVGWEMTKYTGNCTLNASGGKYTFNYNALTNMLEVLYADTTAPTAEISASNDVSESQTVKMTLSDNSKVDGYYWGTNSSYENNTYTKTADTTVTQTVSEAGTYYFTVKDLSGNVSETKSITFYKTTLDANGGDVTPAYILTAQGNTVTLPVATKPGSNFIGWATSASATSGVTELNPTANSTYYAVWEDKDFCLFGWIDGADVGCGDDYQTVKNVFVNSTVTVTFEQDSYVAVKTTDNKDWYMFTDVTTDTTGTLYNTSTGTTQKMFVPAGEIIFNLVKNEDGSLTLSYEKVKHTYTVAGSQGLCGTEWRQDDANNDMTDNGDGTYTKVYENVGAGTYEFKVAKDHSWDTSYGNDGANVVCVVENEGATVTINFDENTEAVTFTVEGGVVPEKVVYFVNSGNWESVYVHLWDSSSSTKWPGQQMTKTELKDVNGFDVYSYTFTEDYTNCVFNNGSGTQTADLELKDANYYFNFDGTWYSSLDLIPVVKYNITYKYNTYDGIGVAGELTENTYTVTAIGEDVLQLVNSNIPVITNPYFDYELSAQPTVNGSEVAVTLKETAKQYTVVIGGKEYTAEYMELVKVSYDTLKSFAIEGEVVSVAKSFTCIVTGNMDISVADATNSTAITENASLNFVGLRIDNTNVYMELLASASVEDYARMGVAFAKGAKTNDELASAIKEVTTDTSVAQNGIAVHNSKVTKASITGQYQFTYAPYISKGEVNDGDIYFYAYAVKTDGTVVISNAEIVNPADVLK